MIHFWQMPSARACALLFAVTAAADFVLLRANSLSIAPGVFETVFTLLATLGALIAICALVIWRLKGDLYWVARLMTSICSFVIDGAVVALAFSLLSVALAIFCFASNALALPLQDGAFNAIDQFFGFDWLQLTAWVSARPALAQTLAWSYSSCMNQMGLVVIALLVTRRLVQLWDLVTVIMYGLAVTLVVAALFPAASPAVYLQPDAALLGTMRALGATYDYIESFAAIRAGSQTAFSIDAMRGIITFPSYHVVFALAVVYAVRHWTLLVWPCAMLNLAVIVSAVPVGGHYVVDLAGGIAVFVLCIYFVDAINGRRTVLLPLRRRWQPAEAFP